MVPFNRYHGDVASTRGPGFHLRRTKKKRFCLKIRKIQNLESHQQELRFNWEMCWCPKFNSKISHQIRFFAGTPFSLSSDTHKPYHVNRNKILQTSIHIFGKHHNSHLEKSKSNYNILLRLTCLIAISEGNQWSLSVGV